MKQDETMNIFLKKTGVAVALIIAAMIPESQGAIHIAGELTADMRGYLLDAESSTWINQDVDGDTLGDFTANAGNVNVTNMAGHLALAVLGDGNHALQSGTAPASMLGNHDATVEAWLYVPAPFVADNTVVGYGSNDSSGQHARSYRYAASGSYNSGLFSAWYQDKKWDEDSDLIPTNWVHVAWVVSAGGGTIKGYVNGVLETTETLSPTLDTQSSTVSIGSRNGGTSADAYKGYVADLRIHTGVLPDAYIYSNYVEGVVNEYTTYTTNIGGAAAPTILGLDNQSVYEGANVTLSPIVDGTAPIDYQWYSNGVAVLWGTNGTLVVTNVTVAANDGDVYKLIANNSAGADTNSMTLTVLAIPDIGPVTVNLDVNNSPGDAYEGVAVAPGTGTTWNQFLAAGDVPYVFESVSDASGNLIPGCTITIDSSGGWKAWRADSPGNPNPLLLMKDYLWQNTYTITISGLPEGEYDFYAYAHGDASGQTSTVTVDETNGGGTLSTTDYGEFRNIFQVNAETNSYLKFESRIPAGTNTFTFTVGPYLNGFQLQSAHPVISEIPDQAVFSGSENVITPPDIAGRAPFAYQWMSNGVVVATTDTLVLNGVTSGQDGQIWELVASNAFGSDTNSFALKVIEGDYDTLRVDLNLDTVVSGSTNTTPLYYSGTAISSDTGTHWNYITPSSDVTIENAKDSQGNTTDYSITIGGGDFAIYQSLTNLVSGSGEPNPQGLMAEYLHHGPYTVTVSNLPPGEYNLYVYAHGDTTNQASTVSLDLANGGASGATTDVGEFRNIYQANAESNSYVKVAGTVGGEGTFIFTTGTYLNGFQLQRVATGVGPINIQSISVIDGMVNLYWTADAGSGYSIEHASSMTGTSWSEVTNVTSVGVNDTMVPASGDAQEFFRISK